MLLQSKLKTLHRPYGVQQARVKRRHEFNYTYRVRPVALFKYCGYTLPFHYFVKYYYYCYNLGQSFQGALQHLKRSNQRRIMHIHISAHVAMFINLTNTACSLGAVTYIHSIRHLIAAYKTEYK